MKYSWKGRKTQIKKKKKKLRSRSSHTALKFFKCHYLNCNLSQSIHIWNKYLGGFSEIPKEHTHELMPGVGVRGQNLGHLCNVVCICVEVIQMYISRQSLIIKHLNLKLRYLGGSSDIPKEHISGFMLGGGARGQNLGHPCNVICICINSFQMLISQQSLITKHSYLKLGYLEGLLRFQNITPLGSCLGVGLGVKI